MEKIVIGVDPHKLSATLEVVDHRETVLGSGRFTTDKVGYAAMRRYVEAWPKRIWAVEGSNGAGRPLAQRLLADGEHGHPQRLQLRVGRQDAQGPGSNRGDRDRVRVVGIGLAAMTDVQDPGPGGEFRGHVDHVQRRAADPEVLGDVLTGVPVGLHEAGVRPAAVRCRCAG
jgi:hypothetical protein